MVETHHTNLRPIEKPTYYASGISSMFSKMRISSPGTQKFPGNSLFQLFLKFPLFPFIPGKKGVILGGGPKLSSPGGPCTTLSTSIRFFQASGPSFSVIFTPHSSSGRAECECLSYVHRFQLIFDLFHLFMPSLVLSCSPPSNIGKPVLLCSADSDL